MKKITFLKDFSISALTAGFVAVLVSFAGPSVIVFQAAQVADLSQAQLSSWIWAISIASGLSCLLLSIKYKVPVICAWSTPGAALLVTSLMNYGYNDAIGAFLVSSFLIFLLGVTGIFAKAMDLVPKEISAALLAGILLNFGLDVFHAAQNSFISATIMIGVYYIAKRFFLRYAVLLSLVAGMIFSYSLNQFYFEDVVLSLARPMLTMPGFSIEAIIGLGLPLFVVTMVSQNVPGVSVMRAASYKAPISPIISTTGVMSLLFASFGSHAINLAAITAAICTNEEAHIDPARRYIAGIFCGLFYIFVGIFGATLVSLFVAMPKDVVIVIAGLALMGSLMSSLIQSLESPQNREAGLMTFLVTASGFTLFGIGSAFWGLITGIVVFLFNKK
ncbi:benzoate/H(+) symporter BenE family transporter [Candidatus Spongiihabitans sp.]|uniref:benzoate/H(+) symporter BenE family transporter n=1 Tax=Candidatus Spongiihabitans sp. TaxID=3101308 RepID=UPI003C705E57